MKLALLPPATQIEKTNTDSNAPYSSSGPYSSSRAFCSMAFRAALCCSFIMLRYALILFSASRAAPKAMPDMAIYLSNLVSMPVCGEQRPQGLKGDGSDSTYVLN